METSPTPNSNGKTLEDKIFSYLSIFFSPRQFWAVYGYWMSLIYYSFFYRSSRFVGSEVSYNEALCPFFWGCSDSVYLFFFVIVFFIFSIFYKILWSVVRNNRALLVCGLLHIIFAILLTDFVNTMLSGLFWVMLID
mgnify:CR=1 FL=1